jgi:hypothetical protein
MNRSVGLTIFLGAAVTAAAFVAGHNIYGSGNQKAGYLVGMLAMAPLALSLWLVWRRTGQRWAKTLFTVVIGLWVFMVIFSLM